MPGSLNLLKVGLAHHNVVIIIISIKRIGCFVKTQRADIYISYVAQLLKNIFFEKIIFQHSK